MLSIVLGLCALVFVGVVGYRLWEYHRLSPVREGISALKAGDYQLALSKLKPFAEAGNTLAQRVVGEMYAFGLGVPVDEIRASIWFRHAECACDETGHIEYDVALMYLQGYAGKRDKTAAIKWLQRAAEAGHPTAQILLTDSSKLAAKGLTVDPSVSDYWRGVVQKQ